MAVARGVDPFGLSNRLVLVTGGTQGIGRAVADAFAQAGAHVAVTSRRAEKAERAAADIKKKSGGRAAGFACDVADRRAVEALFQSLDRWHPGPIATVANIAGHEVVEGWWSKRLHELAPEEVEEATRTVAGVDLAGARWATYFAVPRMLRAGRGSLVYVSSTPALTGYQGFPYTEAKAAVLGLMRDVARAYGPKGIRANAVAPGNIRTGWLEKVPPAERRALEKENPLRRFGEPAEVASAVLFLASDLSSFVTGETLIVDGGTFMR